MEPRNGRVVVLVDYDNFEICIRRDLAVPADLVPVVRYCQSLGTIVSARAYGSWDDPQLRMMVYRSGVEPSFAPVFPTSGMQAGEGKSVADTALVADGIDLLHLLRPDVMVVVSSDKDLIPLVRMAKLRGTFVTVIGSDYTAAQLATSADRLVTYREIIGAPRRRGEHMPSPPATYAAPLASTGYPAAVAPYQPPMMNAAPPPAAKAPVDQLAVNGTTKRRRRRRGRGKGENGTDGVEGAVEEILIDAGEGVEPEVAEEAEAIVEAAEALAAEELSTQEQHAAEPEEPQTGGRSLPFRRPEVLARLGAEAPAERPRRFRERPRDSERPRAVPQPAEDILKILPEPVEEMTLADIEDLALETPEPVAGEAEIRRPDSAIGPIRAKAEPGAPQEPEETAGNWAVPEPEDTIIRPPLESIIGQLRHSEATEATPRVPEAASQEDVPAQPSAEAVAPATAQVSTEPAASADSETVSRRRRRRTTKTEAGVPADEAPDTSEAAGNLAAIAVNAVSDEVIPNQVIGAVIQVGSEEAPGTEATAEARPNRRRGGSRKKSEQPAEPPVAEVAPTQEPAVELAPAEPETASPVRRRRRRTEPQAPTA